MVDLLRDGLVFGIYLAFYCLLFFVRVYMGGLYLTVSVIGGGSSLYFPMWPNIVFFGLVKELPRIFQFDWALSIKHCHKCLEGTGS